MRYWFSFEDGERKKRGNTFFRDLCRLQNTTLEWFCGCITKANKKPTSFQKFTPKRDMGLGIPYWMLRLKNFLLIAGARSTNQTQKISPNLMRGAQVNYCEK